VFTASMGIVVSCVSIRRLTSPTAWRRGPLRQMCLPKSRDFGAQHADVVQEKSAADSKCRKLAEKVAALEGERTDLRRQLVEERREANQAIAKA
jgi:hypothetical protein